MARDRKVPLPLHQLLVYPVAGTDMTTESFKENADAKPLNKVSGQPFRIAEIEAAIESELA